jgi:F0F1-type ATP synthase beta subunit
MSHLELVTFRSIAEYFRDGAGTDQGKDVLFFVDNLPFYSSRF